MNICFVCTGNTCRSPMAAGLLEKSLREKGREDIKVFSCGTNAVTGAAACEYAVQAAAEQGAQLSAHRSVQLSAELMEKMDVVYGMTGHHVAAVAALFPRKKVHLLGGGIPDPYGGDLDCYRQCAQELLFAIQDLELWQ